MAKNFPHALTKLWQDYSQEVLAWHGMDASAPAQLYSNEELERHMQRGLTNSQRAGHSYCLLLACHEKALDYYLHYTQDLPAPLPLLILESQPQRAKAFLQQCAPLPSHVHMLVDSSPWALFMLTALQGLKPEQGTLLFSCPPKARPSALEKWRKLFLGAKAMPLPSIAQSLPRLSVGAIMHPDEPHLEDFFARIPPWVHEVVVVWDAEHIPERSAYACPAPLRHYCRPLQNDFSAQRNAMLAHARRDCGDLGDSGDRDDCADWLLYLDADERLSPESWQALPALMQDAPNGGGGGGVLFPRQTFEGDAAHIRMAFGLWPDVQLRLFPLHRGAYFAGSIHEKVLGLEASPFLAPHCPILHYSHIYKDQEQLRQRLAVFNAAGHVEHRLSEAYPRLAQSFFQQWQQNLTPSPFVWHLPV